MEWAPAPFICAHTLSSHSGVVQAGGHEQITACPEEHEICSGPFALSFLVSIVEFKYKETSFLIE